MIRILLIEDDDVSRAFLAEALGGSASAVTACGGFTEALRHCSVNRFDLIVSDIRLEDGTLYEMARCLPAGTPVLATSAQDDAGVRARLGTLGIGSLLAKPATVNGVRDAVEHILDMPVYHAEIRLWDEQHSLRALGGNAAAMHGLKSLFRTELPDMAGKIRRAFDSGNTDEIHALLHKLKASCGFLGASRLLDACISLDRRPDRIRLEGFMQALDETLATL
jgi:CheY-like chemotaxis protein